MTALPAATDFTGSSVTEAGFKTAITNLRAFLAGVIGTAGTQADALAAIGAPFNDSLAKSGAYTVAATDRGKIIVGTGTGWTLSLAAAATLGDGFFFGFWHSGSGSITIDPNGSEQIDSGTTKAVVAGQMVLVYCNGSEFVTVGSASAVSTQNIQIYTSGSGNWTCPQGVTQVRATVIGGGGGGADSLYYTYSGAPGGIAVGNVTVTPGSSYAYTVGAGGAAGTSTGLGSAGSTSSFNSSITATGGGGGGSSVPSSGAGSGGSLYNSPASTVATQARAHQLVQGVTARGSAASSTAAVAWSATLKDTTSRPIGAGAGGATDSAGLQSGGVGGVVIIEY